jgi:hypothetical protein
MQDAGTVERSGSVGAGDVAVDHASIGDRIAPRVLMVGESGSASVVA